MSSHILSLFGKLRKKKTVILSNEEKVKALGDKAVGLFDHMKKAHSELETINVELVNIATDEEVNMNAEIESHNRKIEKMVKNRSRAMDEMRMNVKIQEELAKFVR
jgi:hypothetical protein